MAFRYPKSKNSTVERLGEEAVQVTGHNFLAAEFFM
jgi:hypothetical protein